MQVSWSVELEIRPGCLDDFEELTVKWWLRLVQKAVFWATNDSSVTTDKRFTRKNVTKAPRQRLLIFANSLRPSASAFQPWSSGSALSCLVIQAMNSGPCWGSIGRPITDRLAHLPIGAEPPTQFQVRA